MRDENGVGETAPWCRLRELGPIVVFDLRRLDQACRRRQSWQRRLGGLALRFGALEPTHALGWLG